MIQERFPSEWAMGWKLVLACFAGFSLFSMMSASISVFMAPLGREFGWSRTLLSAGVAIASATTAVLSPAFGVLIDRYGPRRVAMPGLFATAAAIAAFSFTNGSPAQWLALWTFYAIISISVKTTVWTAAITGSFRASQGLALGITLSGTAAAQAIAPPLATLLIEHFGWRTAYAWLGLGWGGVTIVLCHLFLRDRTTASPHHGENRVAPAAPPTAPLLDGMMPSQALRCWPLWRIAIATLLMITFTIGLLIHQIEILTGNGLSALDAAWAASLAGISGIAGKLLTGVLLDRYRPHRVSGVTLAITALGFLLLLDEWRIPALVVPALMICGYAAGTALQIGSFLTARQVGLRNFGTIYGVMTSLVALGSGFGPLLAGMTYDLHGSYTPFLLGGAAASVLSSLLVWSLPRFPDWQAPS